METLNNIPKIIRKGNMNQIIKAKIPPKSTKIKEIRPINIIKLLTKNPIIREKVFNIKT